MFDVRPNRLEADLVHTTRYAEKPPEGVPPPKACDLSPIWLTFSSLKAADLLHKQRILYTHT